MFTINEIRSFAKHFSVTTPYHVIVGFWGLLCVVFPNTYLLCENIDSIIYNIDSSTLSISQIQTRIHFKDI